MLFVIVLQTMVKKSIIKTAVKLREDLIENKNFLLLIEKAKTIKKTQKLIKSASISELDILKDLIENISDKNIQIRKNLLDTKKKYGNVVSLIASFKRTSSIHKSKASLRRFLIKFAKTLPIIVKTVLA